MKRNPLPMKRLILIPAIAASIASSLFAQEAPPAAPAWTNTSGATIHGEFVRLDGQAVVIRKDGNEFTIPFSRLTGDSIIQAERLAKAAPGPPVPAPVSETPAQPRANQEDPEHERKLAESVLAKNGTIEIWKGKDSHASVSEIENLPPGRVSLKWVNATGAPLDESDIALLNGCHNLTRLDIHRATLDDLPLESLPRLDNLELSDCAIPPSAFAGLRGSKTLWNVAIHGNSIPLDGSVVEILSTCGNLNTLTLYASGLDESSSLLPLTKLGALRHLNIGGNRFDDSAFTVLAQCRGLETLRLHGTDLSGHSLDFLPKLRNVRVLGLTGCKLPDHALAHVAAMPGLTNLDMPGSDVRDFMLADLGGHKTLRELRLSDTSLEDGALAGLAPLSSLTILERAGKPAPGDTFVSALPTVCPNLAHLVINTAHLTPSGWEHITKLRSLSRLHTEDAVLDESVIRSLGGIRSLSSLSLKRSSITGPLLAQLADIKPRLTELTLEGTEIDDSSIETILKFRSLAFLSIRGTNISQEGVERLKKELPRCNIES